MRTSGNAARQELTRLKYVAHLQSGGTPAVDDPRCWEAPDADRGRLWASIADLTRERLVRSTQRRVSDVGIERARLVVAGPGTLLFAMYASLGTMGRLAAPGCWNQAILGIQPRPGHDSAFIEYSLGAIRPQLQRWARSNTQDNLNAEQVGNLPLPAASETQQKQRADFLNRECERISSAMAAAERMLLTLAEQRSEMFDRATHDAPRIALRYLLDRIDQGWSPDCEAQLAEPGEWGVLKVGCVNYGSFRWREHKRLPSLLAPRPDLQIFPGDLLMSRANTRELVGSAAVVDDVGDRRLMLSDKTYRLRPIRDAAGEGFIAMALRSRAVRDQIEMATAGASASMQNISRGIIRELRVPDLPLTEQQELEGAVMRRQSVLEAGRAALVALGARLAEYRNALITEAVMGQLDGGTLPDRQMDERMLAVVEAPRA